MCRRSITGAGRREGRRNGLLLALPWLLGPTSVGLFGQTAAPDVEATYPEGARLDAKQFIGGLKKRGLTDLLALHLRDHPPADAQDAALLARDIKLAEFVDPSRSPAQRAEAIAEANDILQSLIDQAPNSAGARTWMMDLAKSLVYEQAERSITNIFYYGGNAADRGMLQEIMSRALEVLASLHAALTREFDGLDTLPARKYDALESTGAIDKLEADLARTEYLRAWVRFYHALTLPGGSAARVDSLREVLDYLDRQSALLRTPHNQSHVQAQALVLAGMCRRQLGEHAESRLLLGQALDAASAIAEARERGELAWVITLARIEMVRGFVDAGSFKAAREALNIYRQELDATRNGDLPQRLAIGLLDRAVDVAQAAHLAKRNPSESKSLRAKSVASLAELARTDESTRAAVYEKLAELLADERQTASLEPLERCALLAGHLGRAKDLEREITRRLRGGADALSPEISGLETERSTRLDEAIAVADTLIDSAEGQSPPMDDALRAESLYNAGAALYQRGRRLDAAQRFLRLASDRQLTVRAEDAAALAVQLAADLHQDPALAADAEIQRVYLEALRALTSRFPDSARARYWQFFLAQLLASRGEPEQAAEAYARVDPQHERYFEAQYLSLEARFRAMQQTASTDASSVEQIGRRASAFHRSAVEVQDRLAQAQAASDDAPRLEELRSLTARVTLLTAEVHALPGVHRWEKSLETLENFESKFSGQSSLIGRVLRVRMVAHEALGRHEEASRLIPQYVASDPDSAARTLQELFTSLGEEIERDRRAGKTEQAAARAESAVVIARGLYELGQQQPGRFSAESRYAFRLQWADAALDAGQFQDAKRLYGESLAEDAERSKDRQPRDSRALFGSAEAHYQLGEHESALPLFNRVFRGAPRQDRIWWKSLLRDLQCRTALGQDPHSIIKSIQQHKHLSPAMGAPEIRRQFDELLTANERRRSEPGSSDSP